MENINDIRVIVIYTNRSVGFFNKDGKQMAELQSIFNCYADNQDKEWEILKEIFPRQEEIDFYVSDFGVWRFPITFEKVCFMLGHGRKIEGYS
jgi:hypothetical protein